jgi:hypothetical protein
MRSDYRREVERGRSALYWVVFLGKDAVYERWVTDVCAYTVSSWFFAFFLCVYH